MFHIELPPVFKLNETETRENEREDAIAGDQKRRKRYSSDLAVTHVKPGETVPRRFAKVKTSDII